MEYVLIFIVIAVLLLIGLGIASVITSIYRFINGRTRHCTVCNMATTHRGHVCSECGASDDEGQRSLLFHSLAAIGDLTRPGTSTLFSRSDQPGILQFHLGTLRESLTRLGSRTRPSDVLLHYGVTQRALDMISTGDRQSIAPPPPPQEKERARPLVQAPPLVQESVVPMATPMAPQPSALPARVNRSAPRLPVAQRPQEVAIEINNVPLAERVTRLLLTLGVSGLAVAALIVLSAHNGEYSPLKMGVFSILTAAVFGGGVALRKWLKLEWAGVGFLVLAGIFLPLNVTAARVFGLIDVESIRMQWAITLLACAPLYAAIAWIGRLRTFGFLTTLALSASIWFWSDYGAQIGQYDLWVRDTLVALACTLWVASTVVLNRPHGKGAESTGGIDWRFVSIFKSASEAGDGIRARLASVFLAPARFAGEVGAVLLVGKMLALFAFDASLAIESFASAGLLLSLLLSLATIHRNSRAGLTLGLLSLVLTSSAFLSWQEAHFVHYVLSYTLLCTLNAGLALTLHKLARANLTKAALWAAIIVGHLALGLGMLDLGYWYLPGIHESLHAGERTLYLISAVLLCALASLWIWKSRNEETTNWYPIIFANVAAFAAIAQGFFLMGFDAEFLIPGICGLGVINIAAALLQDRRSETSSDPLAQAGLAILTIAAAGHLIWRLLDVPAEGSMAFWWSAALAIGALALSGLVSGKERYVKAMALLLPLSAGVLLRAIHGRVIPSDTNLCVYLALAGVGMTGLHMGLNALSSRKIWSSLSIGGLLLCGAALGAAWAESLANNFELISPTSVFLGSAIAVAYLTAIGSRTGRPWLVGAAILSATLILPSLVVSLQMPLQNSGVALALWASLWSAALLNRNASTLRSAIAVAVGMTLIAAIALALPGLSIDAAPKDLRAALTLTLAALSVAFYMAREPRRESAALATLLAGSALGLWCASLLATQPALCTTPAFALLALAGFSLSQRSTPASLGRDVKRSLIERHLEILPSMMVRVSAVAASIIGLWRSIHTLALSGNLPSSDIRLSALCLSAAGLASGIALALALRAKEDRASLLYALATLLNLSLSVFFLMRGIEVAHAWMGLPAVALALASLSFAIATKRKGLSGISTLMTIATASYGIGSILFPLSVVPGNDLAVLVTCFAAGGVMVLAGFLTSQRFFHPIGCVLASVGVFFTGEYLGLSLSGQLVLEAILSLSVAALALALKQEKDKQVFGWSAVALAGFFFLLTVANVALGRAADVAAPGAFTQVLLALSFALCALALNTRWLYGAAALCLALGYEFMLIHIGIESLEAYLAAPSALLIALGVFELRRNDESSPTIIPSDMKIAGGLILFFLPSLIRMLALDAPLNAGVLFAAAIAMTLVAIGFRIKSLFFGGVASGFSVLGTLLVLVIPFYGIGIGWWIGIASAIAIAVAIVLERRINTWIRQEVAQARKRLSQAFAGWR